MKKLLVIAAAIIGILLLSVAIFSLGLGVLSRYQQGQSGVLGLLTFALIFLVPGFLLYRFAARSLQDRSRLRLHSSLGVCSLGCAALLAIPWYSGGFNPNLMLRNGELQINGPLTRETLREFREVMASEDLRNVRVRLRSPGGDILAAMAIGREIYRLQLDVEVDRQCASACANYLFPAGRNKYLESARHVQFHGGALQPNYVDAALDMIQAGTQLSVFDPDSPPEPTDEQQLRELYGLREDYPFNPAGGILVEKAYFDDIGVSQLTPVFGQYGDYAAWFNDGVHDTYYYAPDDFARLGVADIHISDPDENYEAGDSDELFRARVSTESVDALHGEIHELIQRVEASMPFDAGQIWIE